MPKNLVKTPLRLPKPNYSKNKFEFDNLKMSKDEKSIIFEQNKSYGNNFNNKINNILPIIKNSKKDFYEKNKIDLADNNKFVQKLLYNNNIKKDLYHNKCLINNFNFQWMKLRSKKNNYNINNNKINNNSYDAMKIFELYKPPSNILNNLKKMNQKEEYSDLDKSNEQILPKIRRNIYSQIKIIPKRNPNLK